MMNFIVKTNQWYESLSDLKGFIFYLSLVFLPYVALMLFLNKPYFYFSIFWPVLVALWRLSYKIYNEVWEKKK